MKLGAPVSGWALPLEEVPDPVFAERMMGDGFAIDPLEGLIVAPADATVATLAPTGHAVTLSLANGASLLIHIGLETVALGGEGFEPLVAPGQQVTKGTSLIRFDMDLVARRAKSLVTPIVLIDAGYRLLLHGLSRRVSVGEILCEVDGAGESAVSALPAAGTVVERQVQLRLPNGLHARPAARIVNALASRSAHLSLSTGNATADARSIVALLSLGLKAGDEVTLSAQGEEAAHALADIAAVLEDSSHEPAQAIARPPAVASDGLIAGVGATAGLAIGPIAHYRPPAIEVATDGAGESFELEALDRATRALADKLRKSGDRGSGVMQAHLALLNDSELISTAKAEIAAGRSAGFAWRSASARAAQAIEATGDAMLIERVADLEDVERQLLSLLGGTQDAPPPQIAPGSILVADDLLPSQFIALGGNVAGIATARGGPTSHVAVLAASAGIPMLVAAGPSLLALAEGAVAILDASAGTLDPAPGPEALMTARQRLAGESARREADLASAREDCRTSDGRRIEIVANLASVEDASSAVMAGAEGCGLLRTEFLFQDRAEPPTEAEQAEAYAAIAASLGGRPMIIRTFDIGGDKPVPYLPIQPEENPALGQRGIRLALEHPELLDTQLRAILRAVSGPQCRIMVPMVIERDELRVVRARLDVAIKAVGRSEPVALGAMVETPAAALLAASLAEEADFLSVGTNDLTQYTLACDRGNSSTAPKVDALHPAVLGLIAAASDGAATHGKWLGICGGLASDPSAAAILIGLGATELSAAPAMIPALKARVRSLGFDQCRRVADRALRCASAAEVRALVAEPFEAMKGAA